MMSGKKGNRSEILSTDLTPQTAWRERQAGWVCVCVSVCVCVCVWLSKPDRIKKFCKVINIYVGNYLVEPKLLLSPVHFVTLI